LCPLSPLSDNYATSTPHTLPLHDALPIFPTSPEQAIPGGYRQRFHNGAIYRNTGASHTAWLFGAIYAEYQRLNEAKSPLGLPATDRKSTRLNSSHEWISYAVFCLKKKHKN